ncbi:Eukaryotic translation initiation factor 2D [Dinochytrium kinnereticum]|nr:Eukaryotic translation initiation factor 2D [Dinochytrium kinnereticum]
MPRFTGAALLALLICLLPVVIIVHADDDAPGPAPAVVPAIRVNARPLDDTHVRVLLQSTLSNIGWLAVGFGERMEGSDIVVTWRMDDGTPVVSHRRGVPEHQEPQYVQGSDLATLSVTPDAGEEEVSSFTYSVEFDLFTPALMREVTSEPQRFIWAYGMAKPDSSDPGARLTPHSPQSKGFFEAGLLGRPSDDETFTWEKAAARAAAALLSQSNDLPNDALDAAPDGANVGRPPFNPDGTPSEGVEPLPGSVVLENATVTGPMAPSETGVARAAGGARSEAEEKERYRLLIKAHGSLMFIAWGVLAPIGLFLARYTSGGTYNYIPVHSSTMFFGTVLLTVISFILAAAATGGYHFDAMTKGPHVVIGLIMFLGTILQPVLALLPRSYRTRNYSLKNRARTVTENIHKWLGRSLQILAIANLYLGLTLYERSNTVYSSVWSLFSIWLILLAALFAFFEGRATVTTSIPPLDATYHPPSKEDAAWVQNLRAYVGSVSTDDDRSISTDSTVVAGGRGSVRISVASRSSSGRSSMRSSLRSSYSPLMSAENATPPAGGVPPEAAVMNFLGGERLSFFGDEREEETTGLVSSAAHSVEDSGPIVVRVDAEGGEAPQRASLPLPPIPALAPPCEGEEKELGDGLENSWSLSRKREKRTSKRGQTTIRSSDRRKLRAEVLKTFPSLTEEQLNLVLPTAREDETVAVKFTAHSGVVGVMYVVAGEPMFFRIDEGGVVPTVYALWKVPSMLPTLTTHGVVMKKLIDGADLMLPGVIIPSEGFEPDSTNWKVGDPVGVVVKGNPFPMAVGFAIVSGSEVRMALRTMGGMRGKGVRTLHAVGDFVWSAGSKMGVPGVTGEAEDSDEYEAVDDDAPATTDDIADPVSTLSISETTPSPSQHTEASSETPPTVTPAEMDKLLEEALITAIKLKLMDDPKSYPVTASVLYESFVLPCRADRTVIDVKMSGFKKLAKFLKAMEKKGYIKLKERNGETLLMSVNRKHPEIAAFDPPRKLARAISASSVALTVGKATAASPSSAVSSPSAALASSIAIVELYRATGGLAKVFGEIGVGRDAYLTRQEVKAVIDEYVKSKDLVADDPRLVKLDAGLAEALHRKDESDVDVIGRESLMTRVMEKLSPFHRIAIPGLEAVIRKGTPKPINITVEIRQGRKTVTRITGVETYGIDPEILASELKVLCASSTTVSPLPSKTSTPLFEVMIQGSKVREVCGCLAEKYFLPFTGGGSGGGVVNYGGRGGPQCKFVEVLDKTEKK